MWVYYDGPNAGGFSVNSKAKLGEKLRIRPLVPTWLIEGDEWMVSLPGFHTLTVDYWTPLYDLAPIKDMTYLPLAQGAWLAGLAMHTPDPAKVVEIGTGQGCSLIRILYGLSLHKTAHVWSIDLVDKREATQASLIQTGIPSVKYTLVTGDSSEIGRHWTAEIDMMYIDGRHSYEGVSDDILIWTPHVKIGGVVVFDDYGNDLHQVTKAVDEHMTYVWKRLGQIGTMVAFRKE